MSLSVTALVLAAGSGDRFGGHKQFLELRPGVTLLDAAIDSVIDLAAHTCAVLPDFADWQRESVATVVGGASRIESVWCGLTATPEDTDVVLIHDAAHPLASSEIGRAAIAAVIDGADAAVPFLQIPDVVKRLGDGGSLTTVGRDGLGLAQVPMAFRRDVLVSAHERAQDAGPLWEDSQLIERCGGSVVAVAGSAKNLHVVDQDDLELVRAISALDTERSE